MPTDEALVKKVISGDKNAFGKNHLVEIALSDWPLPLLGLLCSFFLPLYESWVGSILAQK